MESSRPAKCVKNELKNSSQTTSAAPAASAKSVLRLTSEVNRFISRDDSVEKPSPLPSPFFQEAEGEHSEADVRSPFFSPSAFSCLWTGTRLGVLSFGELPPEPELCLARPK